MIKTIAIALALGLLAIAPLALAEDGNNVPDQLGDIFSGKGNTYGGLEVINIPVPFLELLTMTAWFDAMVGEVKVDGEKVQRDVRGGVRVVLDWEKVFKPAQ